jgi:hypothetical protein
MFGGLKKILGIEGVKIDIVAQEPVNISDRVVKGKIVLSTLMDSKVSSISMKLIEKYTRGRKDSKLIDEYTVGYVELSDSFLITKNEVIEIPFELPFVLKDSEMDKMQKSNFILGGIIKLAKLGKGVKSEFRIEAEALIPGTKLNPLCKKTIIIS